MILRDRKVGANENRHEDGGRLSRDRWFESGSLQRRVQCETIRSRKREDKPAAEVRRSVPQIVQRAMIEVLKAMYEEDFPWVAPELFDVVQARPRGAAKWGGRPSQIGRFETKWLS